MQNKLCADYTVLQNLIYNSSLFDEFVCKLGLFLARVGHFKTRVKRENNWLPTKITLHC
jgi:hypothetical protein